MPTVNQEVSRGEACLTSMPVGLPEDTVPRNPQASYYRARYYDPTGGRFLSEDPIGFGGGNVDLYSHVLNSPTNLIDPSGWRPGDKYPNAKCAGWNAVNDYNPTSITQNKEYGGFIYRNPDGTFSYTDPHVNKDAGIGDANGIPRFWQIPIPPNTQRGGWYHTHAGGPMSPINSDFSPQDMDIFDKSLHGSPGFLGVPNGQVRMYIPNPGNPEHGISFPLSSKNCGCQK